MIPLKMPSDIVHGGECLELGYPWLVPESVNFLNENLNDKDVICEFGMGGSTVFFTKRCRWVVSFETNEEWFDAVLLKLKSLRIDNIVFTYTPNQQLLLDYDKYSFSVLSVDTQGGINRSAILNAFLEKGVSPNLRMIILDNYGHEGLFPDHWDKENIMGEGWEELTYTHERWAGSGTKIIIKK